MNASSPALSLHFAPILPLSWIVLVALCGIVLMAYGLWQGRKGTWIRGLCYSIFLLALLNPSILKEDRTSTQDVAVIVVDKSMSQTIGKRSQRTEAALKSITAQTTKLDSNLDVRVIEAPEDKNLSRETRLFDAVDAALANTPQQRRAGVIFLTDGQIHDIPKNETAFTQYGPVHALLSGERNEKDRQIVITNAPAYGLVGQEVTIKYKIEDTANTGHSHAQVTLTGHDGEQKTSFVPIGEEQSVSLHIGHPSQNVFTLEVESVEGEITFANNKSAILINGVRDRLKVLLVSGKPHGGARTWRDLLTSDPGVDLVHFTILREPQKLDYTPQDEVSLIAFPFEELFEIKLYDFDLIVFDQYRLNNILPEHYFSNIARYVEEGGAFLEASGSDYAHANFSLYRSPLRDILPASPTGNIFQKPFKPELTELGGKHPVTRSLVWNNVQNDFGKEPNWGRWLRQIDIQAERGDVLLQGLEKKPLLVLDRVGKGRVAQLASDHVWMWARGYEGGGPHAELLRRVVHWLMKEPELDERALDVKVEKNTITIRKQFIDQKNETIAMTDPNGEQSTIELKDRGDGWLAHKLEAKSLGIYAFEDTLGNRKFAIIGDLNPPELRSVITTEEKIKPLLIGSKGGAIWLEQTPSPKIRFLNNARSYAGNSWIALRRNNDYTVTGVKDIPLLPYWAQFLTLVFITIFMWWFEGQRK